MKFYRKSYTHDGVSDMHESSLIRIPSGLLYVSDNETGDIKQSIIKNKTTWHM